MATYRCEVDLYRNGTVCRGHRDRLYDRNTKGVYLMGAKNPKEARKTLQKAIGFGSITVPKRNQWRPDDAPELKRGEIRKLETEITYPDGEDKGYVLVHAYDENIRNATAPVARKG